MHKTIVKAFKYRIYPTPHQTALMEQTLRECCWLYNYFLEQRKTAWNDRKESIGYYSQSTQLPRIKKERPSLIAVHSQVLQNVAQRVDLAFKAFFRRVKAGDNPGYPRFHGHERYSSFCYPQYSHSCKIDGTKLYLPKIGTIKIVLHQPHNGAPKICTVYHSSTGKWFVSIICECEITELPADNTQVGIDVGLHTFAALSTDETIDNPRFFRKEERNLAKAQQNMSKETKGTLAYTKRRKVVARIHERIANKRNDFAHQNSRRIVNQFSTIAVENISINRMLHNHCLAKSISDAAWGKFLQFLTYKAEWAGRKIIAVNPAYTSQTCSKCGHRQPMPLSERIYLCPCCGLEIDRDLNASLNILAAGLRDIGRKSVKVPVVIGK